MLDAEIPQHTIKSPDDSPIFVIGTGRSGTTLLRQMLNAHPRIHITHEAGFYTFARHTPPGVTGTEFLERYFNMFSFAWLGLDPQEIRDALPDELPRAELHRAFVEIMRRKAQQAGKPRYGEKNPQDTLNLEQIFKDYRDPRIVYIIRDPRPTVQSFNRVPFGAPSILLNGYLCRAQYNHVVPYLDKILEVRLEDLTADPRRAMQRILRYVGEPWDEAVLHHTSAAIHDDVPPLPWFAGATGEKPSRQGSDGGWRDRIAPAWIRLIERLNRPAMARYGYAPAQLEREPSTLELCAALWRDLPGIVVTGTRFLSLWAKLNGHFSGRQPMSLDEGWAASLSMNPAAWRHYPNFEMPRVPTPSSRRLSA
jgi:hypothetical protein